LDDDDDDDEEEEEDPIWQPIHLWIRSQDSYPFDVFNAAIVGYTTSWAQTAILKPSNSSF
jgi:hypothetical protein